MVITVITAVVALMMGFFINIPKTVTVIGQKRSLIMLNPSNITSTFLNGSGKVSNSLWYGAER